MRYPKIRTGDTIRCSDYREAEKIKHEIELDGLYSKLTKKDGKWHVMITGRGKPYEVD